MNMYGKIIHTFYISGNYTSALVLPGPRIWLSRSPNEVIHLSWDFCVQLGWSKEWQLKTAMRFASEKKSHFKSKQLAQGRNTPWWQKTKLTSHPSPKKSSDINKLHLKYSKGKYYAIVIEWFVLEGILHLVLTSPPWAGTWRHIIHRNWYLTYIVHELSHDF